MPLSRRVAKFNKGFTNRVTRHIAGWAPGFALLDHVGRRSGRQYETPVNVFAAGNCVLRIHCHLVELANPQRVHDPSRHLSTIPARWILKLVRVEDFVVMEARASH